MGNFDLHERIYSQVIIYLSDSDFVSFFSRCKAALNPNGVIVVKDNVARSGFVLDLDDCSVTRFASLFLPT